MARAAKMVTGVDPAAGPSVPSLRVAAGVLNGGAGAGLGLGSGAHLYCNPKTDRVEAAAPAKSERERATSGGKQGPNVRRRGRCV